MADLQTDVRYIKGIGEKKAQALHKLGIFTLYDLVSCFPRRYEDRSQYKPIALTQDGESVCICALVACTPQLSRSRRSWAARQGFSHVRHFAASGTPPRTAPKGHSASAAPPSVRMQPPLSSPSGLAHHGQRMLQPCRW